MTEKRFYYNVNKNCIEYDGEFVAYLNSRDGCRIANYWNGLYKENEQLRKQREELFIRERDTKNDWRELKQENKQLKQYKDAVLNCDSSKIIRVNRNTGKVDLIDKEYKG